MPSFVPIQSLYDRAVKREEVQVVVGGAGFIGQNLIRELNSISEKSFVIDRALSGNIPLSEFQKNWPRDLAGQIQVHERVRIWHLAANSDIRMSAGDSLLDFENTLGSTLAVIRFVELLGEKCTGIEFTSSSSVYGQGNTTKFKEEDRTNPISYYGVMKSASEQVLEIYTKRKRVPLHTYRLPNVVGASMTHGVIYDLLGRLHEERRVLNVLGNGMQRKVYVHVDDLVSLFVEMMTETESFTINVSNGDAGLSVKEIVDLLLTETNLNPVVKYEKDTQGWPGDVTLCLMDTSKMNEFSKCQFRSSKDAVLGAIRSRMKELTWLNA